MAQSTESSKSLLEILTLVTSANIRGSDNVFTLRSFTYIIKSIGHAVDSYLSVLTLKQSKFYILLTVYHVMILDK